MALEEDYWYGTVSYGIGDHSPLPFPEYVYTNHNMIPPFHCGHALIRAIVETMRSRKPEHSL